MGAEEHCKNITDSFEENGKEVPKYLENMNKVHKKASDKRAAVRAEELEKKQERKCEVVAYNEKLYQKWCQDDSDDIKYDYDPLDSDDDTTPLNGVCVDDIKALRRRKTLRRLAENTRRRSTKA